MNILIVEDDQLLANNIIQEFKTQTPANIIKHISSYEEFVCNSSCSIYDIILIDICLGKTLDKNNGLSILKHIRKRRRKVPIIVMSNIIQYCYLEEAFRLGAHDYLIKPFRVRELQIRIQRWFHSYVFSEFFSYEKVLSYHDLEFIPSSNEFLCKSKKIELSKSNKHLLSLLLINKERLLSQSFLNEKIWGYSEIDSNKNLRIKILRLKKQLEKHGIDKRIKTIHGEGYVLEKIRISTSRFI